MTGTLGYNPSKAYVDELTELYGPIDSFITDEMLKRLSYMNTQPLYVDKAGNSRPIPQQYLPITSKLTETWQEKFYSSDANKMFGKLIEHMECKHMEYPIYHGGSIHVIKPYDIAKFEASNKRSWTLIKAAIRQVNTRYPERRKHRNVTVAHLNHTPATNAEYKAIVQLNVNDFNYQLTQLIINPRDEDQEWQLKRKLKDQMYGTTNCTGISQYNLALLRLLGY